jgi:trehalose 6-phosphate synthase
MQFFRMRLILALVVGITLVSVASTYFEVVSHKHVLRTELERRTAWLSTSLQPEIEKAVSGGQGAQIAAEAARLRSRDEALGLAVYDAQGRLVTAAGPAGIFAVLPRGA